MILWLDIETQSPLELDSVGLAAYATQSRTILACAAIDNKPAQRVTLGELAQLMRAANTIIAHNAAFERKNLERAGVIVPLDRWVCSMYYARAHGMPGALGSLALALGVEQTKEKGAHLIKLFCAQLNPATEDTHPAEWAEFARYCIADVEAMRACFKKLQERKTLLPEFRQYYLLDQRMNDTGAMVDKPLCRAAVTARELITATAKEKSGGLSSRVQAAKEYIKAHGIPCASMAREAVKKMLNSDIPPTVRAILEARQESANTSAAKFDRMLAYACATNRIQHSFTINKAHTGRWGGSGPQLQNLPRPVKHLAGQELSAIGALLASPEAFVMIFGADSGQMLAQLTRYAIIAAPGNVIISADLKQIEARMLAYAADDQAKLDIFRSGADPYIHQARLMFPGQVIDDYLRLLGKICELAFGYGGGDGSLVSFAELYGVQIEQAKRAELIRLWRTANAKTAQLWRRAENYMRAGYSGHGGATWRRHVDGRITHLAHLLRSRRECWYNDVRICEDGISYHGEHSRARIWGGTIVQNANQAECFDIFGRCLLAYDAQKSKNAELIMCVHDEAVIECAEAEAEAEAEKLRAVMSTAPEWARGLPMAGDVKILGKRYKKG